MAIAINMPQVGQDLETAKIIEWHCKEGDNVSKGDIVATVESDKASFEVEADSDGTILQLLFQEGEDAEVFKPIAYIGDTNEKPDIQPEYKSSAKIEEKQVVPQPQVPEKTVNGKIFISPAAKRRAKESGINLDGVTGSGPNGRIVARDVLHMAEQKSNLAKATPLAKKVADDNGVDLKEITGTGIGGRIVRDDIIKARRSQYAMVHEFLADDTVVPFTKMRKRIAERLTLSKQNIPHFYLFADIDVTGTLAWRKKIFDELGVKFSINDILIKNVADSLIKFPYLNAYVDDEKIILKKQVNIGIAVSIEDGLLVPVIPHANASKLAEISLLSKQNAEKARKGIVDVSVQGTFTISNLGMFGISRFQAIINPPESGILSVGAIEKKVVPSDGGLLVKDIMTVGLACDHRAVDGAYAAGFLAELNEQFQNVGSIE